MERTDKLTPLQEKLLEMLKWFHELCVENNIDYYVLGGTMLGAARHQGFIPWDDDIDVGLPRKSYYKLIEVIREYNDSPYTIETPYSNAEEYCYPFSKIYNTKTTLIENKRKKVVRGIYIDVFPLDGLGKDWEECQKNYKRIDKKYNELLLCTAGIRKGRKWYKNAAVAVTRCVPKCLMNGKKIAQELDRLCAAIPYEEAEWICNDMGAWRLKEAMPRKVMGKPRLYRFEGIEVYGAENYDEYLTHLYGDWRKLPPVEKRVTHHDFDFLDLNRPYHV